MSPEPSREDKFSASGGSTPNEPGVTAVTKKRVTLPGTKRLVLQFLDLHPDEAHTLGQIAAAVKRSKGSVKVAAWRAAKGGKVRAIGDGLYQSLASLVHPGLPDPRLRLHGLKLECCYQSKGWPYPVVFQRVTTGWSSPSLHRHPINHGLTGTSEWRGRILRWTIHEAAGLLEVFLEASTAPLHPLLDAPAYFAAVEAVSGIPSEFWLIKQADWNIDLHGSVAADLGVVGLSIAGFGRLIAKVYQKAEDLVRIEARSFEPLSPDAITDYMKSILRTLADIHHNVPETQGVPP